jgi:hypothetical protein
MSISKKPEELKELLNQNYVNTNTLKQGVKLPCFFVYNNYSIN